MVSQAITEKMASWEAFRAAAEPVGTKIPSWVGALREGAFDRFVQLGFPTTDEEDWKYTNVAPIARTAFTPADADAARRLTLDGAAPFLYGEARQSRLIFVNGVYRPDLSALAALPPGVVASDLCAAFAGKQAEAVRRHLARIALYNESGFTALNTGLFDGGAFIYIPVGVSVDSPIQLLFLAQGEDPRRAVFPRVLVIAERDSSATLIESYEAADETVYLTNAVVEVAIGEAARLTHYKVQREGPNAFHVARTGAELGPNSSYDLTTITLGAALSRHDISVLLDHEGAECWVDGLYITGAGQHADTHSLIDHVSPRCRSHQLYKGILDGKSRAVFNGKVYVHKGAQQTDAMQTNKNLLLSNDARVDTKPQLEIFADDVKCAHGATVGQLEEEELFYLASRGLRAETARNLLTYGFAEEVVAKIKIDSIRAQLDEAILNRLHARLEA
jgi:Fe-S cluster assembly protein SufD